MTHRLWALTAGLSLSVFFVAFLVLDFIRTVSVWLIQGFRREE